MADLIFYPNPFEESALALGLAEASSDISDFLLMDYADHDLRNLELLDADGWSFIDLEFKVTYQSSVPPSADHRSESNAFQVFVTLQSAEARRREAFRLQPDSENSWRGTIRIDRRTWAGVIRVTPVATSEDCTKLASGEGWDVYLDKKDVMPGGLLAMEWKKFSESPNSEVASRKECGWYWDLGHETRPKLLVNEEIKHLKDALNVVVNHGRNAMLRNTATQVLLLPALVELVLDCLERLRGESLEDIEGFRKDVLLSVARHSALGDGEKKAQTWLDADRSERDLVHGQVLVGCQRYMKTWGNISKALAQLGGYGDD